MRRRAAAALLLVASCGGPPPNAPVVQVYLPVGSSFSVITDSLLARRVITKPGWFRFLARVGRYDRRIKAGFYEFREGEPPLRVLRTLASGSEKTIRFTLPEGSTLLDLADLASAQLGLSRDSTLAATRDSALLREFSVSAPTFEGYLFPETYFVSKMLTSRDLVREMAKLFQRAWDSSWTERARQAGLDRDKLVILASIVESEARVDEDRPLVAAVYLNRLKAGMPLQADPTVMYAIELKTGARKPRLYEKDYQFPSPYNTYLNPGLPPGPVGAPGRASIEAVLSPANVPYLFFVAQPDGRHVFTRTYAEHLRAIAKVRQMERAARAESARTRAQGARGRTGQ